MVVEWLGKDFALDILAVFPLYGHFDCISTSIVLAAWALGKYSKGAVKMHTLLNLRGIILANIHITDAKWHDSNELDEIVLEPFAFYMMEKGKAFA